MYVCVTRSCSHSTTMLPRADLVSVDVLFSQEQTALGDSRIVLCPKVTGSKSEERCRKGQRKDQEKVNKKANTVKIITEQ